jgi:hypothetical protein
MIKALKKIWYGSSFNIINAAYDKPSQYPPEIISSNIRNKTNMLFSLFLFRIILEVLGRGTQQQKEKKKRHPKQDVYRYVILYIQSPNSQSKKG